MSESGSTVCFSLQPDCLGPVLAPNKVKIVEPGCPEEKPLGPNQVGEIMVLDPNPMMGYLKDEKKTAEFFGKDG